MRGNNTRAYEITMIVHASHDATINDVRSVLEDLSWVGGCRDHLEDPGFDGLEPSQVKIKRMKEKDKK